MTWTEVNNEDGTVFCHLPQKEFNSEKILVLDLDWTLIQPEVGKKFPVSEDDWGFRFPTKKVKDYSKKGYKIAIFSNQKSTFDGKLLINFDNFKNRVVKIAKALRIPVYILAAPKDDFFRKPCPGMWNYLVNHLNGDIKVDKSKCIFVGDAAGRQRQGKKSGDFSDSDLKMAVNAGIDFQTPEQFFQGKDFDKDAAIKRMSQKSYDPAQLMKGAEVIREANKTSWDKLRRFFEGKTEEGRTNLPRILMFSGSPSSGKSSLARKILRMANQKSTGWELFSLDTIKDKAKMRSLISKLLMDSEEGGAIIDCTNGNLNPRSDWITLAQMHKTPIWCIQLLTEKPLAFHLNNLRKARQSIQPNYNSKHVPNVAIHRYFKSWEEPTKEEGIEEIIQFEFEPNFSNDREKTEFMNRF